MNFRLLGAALASLVSLSSMASCPQHVFSDPAQVRLSGNSVMMVTHASSNDDGRIATKFGVDEAIRFAKDKHMPVVYLQDDRPEANYFMEDCTPDYWVFSMDGEVPFDVLPAHLYLIGGHLEECLSRTLHDVLYSWARKPRRDLTVTLFMDGIFSNGKRIEVSDPYHRDFQRFIGIVTYNRPSGERYQKVTLLETMGIILREVQQVEYLERILPHYVRTFGPDYQVEMRLMESGVKVLQRGRGARPPVLRFDFIDSAAHLDRDYPMSRPSILSM